MNFLPIIVILFVLASKRGSSITDTLNLLISLKDNQLVKKLLENGENPLQQFLKGEIGTEDIMQLLSLASSLKSDSSPKQKAEEKENFVNEPSPDMSPIENIAGEEIAGSLEKYLNNAS